MTFSNIKSMMLVAALAVTGICHAEDSVNLGYCAGEVSSNGALTVEGNTWVSGAIFLPSTMIQPYDGLQISAVRAGLASRLNLDSVRVWVRSDLDGPNLSEGIITNKSTPKIKSGWNDVVLEAPVSITAADGLYVGFSYHQKTQTGAFSAVGSELANAFFAQISDTEAWQDMSHLGILSVEATVEGASLPDYDLSITSADIRHSNISNQYHLDVDIANVGQKEISGFTLCTYSTDGQAMGSTTHFDYTLASGVHQTISYEVPTAVISDPENVFVTISGVDDGVDAMVENNTVKAHLALLRKVLIEEFTTERCSNCPRVAEQLHTILNDDKYKDNVIAVCHHAGYYTDDLTQDCDNDLVAQNAYNVNYAPAMMFDRAPIFNGGIHTSPDREIIMTSIDTRLAVETHLSLSFATAYDTDNQSLHVVVNGERNAVFTNKSTRLTVYITEDNVKAKYQSGADNPADYWHQHVIRLYNNTWGDEISWDVNSFEKEYDFIINPDWKFDDLKLVAFVSAYDEADIKNCVVENVEALSLKDAPAGISAVQEDSHTLPIRYYHLDGSAFDERPATGSGFCIEVNGGKSRIISL